MRTRVKIILILVTIFFTLILGFGIVIYVLNSQYTFSDFYKRLEIRSYTSAKIELDHKSTADLIREFKGEYLEPLQEEKHTIIPVNSSIDYLALAKEHGFNNTFLEDIVSKEIGTFKDGSMFFCGILYEFDGKRYIVITSAVNYYYGHHMEYLRNLLIVSILISSIIIVLIAYWLSKKLIDPIKEITIDMNKISTENLNVRLKSNKQEDELGDLIRTFNNMLDRLETSFETQNNFISNASHELNTPLTSIIGEAEVTLKRDRSKEEYVETLQSILIEAEKLDKKTKALLFLAQTGFNGKALKFETVRIDQLIFDVLDTINKIHADNHVALDLSKIPDNPEQLRVKGNEQLLHLALTNLISNACKYSNNQEVVVSLDSKEDTVIIKIVDLGIGIPENEIPYIFDPFFRASNTGNFEGYGIGLPLARNIIRLHGGRILFTSMENKSTEVIVSFPLNIDEVEK